MKVEVAAVKQLPSLQAHTYAAPLYGYSPYNLSTQSTWHSHYMHPDHQRKIVAKVALSWNYQIDTVVPCKKHKFQQVPSMY
jgi:hypothetical protein